MVFKTKKIANRIEFVLAVRDYLYEINNPVHIPSVAEIGVFRGEYSQVILDCFNKVDLHLVDIWGCGGNDVYFSTLPTELQDGYEKVVAKFGKNPFVVIHKVASKSAVAKFCDGYFDWVYIDANHDYESIRQDIEFWYPKVKVDGIISGHDFDPSLDNPRFASYGINRAVRERFGENFGLTNEALYRTWYHVKEK